MTDRMAGAVRIGTSGWHYSHWVGRFYPAHLRPGERLAFYARTFDTVEINSSFYRVPGERAVAGWRAAVPPDFVFAVKGSRFLTHMKKLQAPQSSLRRLLDAVGGLGPKLGPIVFQLPPRWSLDLGRLRRFLRALPRDRRFAIELRDATWHTDSVVELLRRHGVAFCVFDIAGFESPAWVTADFAYVRLHGPGEQAYTGRYSKAQLRIWAERIRHWREEVDAVYVYFDNDDRAFAVENARQLRDLV
jgi:uncharacterized protein YecE (DUF72 family)